MEIPRIVVLSVAIVLAIAALGVATYQQLSSLESRVTYLESTEGIGAGAVETVHLANGAVTTAKIADSAVTTAKIADESITSGKIVNGTIVAADIAAGAITSEKILDGTIVNADIAANANISGSKLAANSVTSTQLADDITVTNLTANDNITIGDNLSIGGNASVTGNVTISGTLSAGGTTLSSLSVSGDSSLASTLYVENIAAYPNADNIKVLDNLQVENLYITGTIGPPTVARHVEAGENSITSDNVVGDSVGLHENTKTIPFLDNFGTSPSVVVTPIRITSENVENWIVLMVSNVTQENFTVVLRYNSTVENWRISVDFYWIAT